MSINVANNNPHVVYTVAEGATQTTFSITFEFFDDDEVQLYVDGIIKTQGSGDGNYTITGGEGSTGTATFNTVSSGIQPVTGITGGSQVVITRNIPIERVTDFSAGSDINRAALNTQLDTLTAIAADNKMRSVRALTAPITDPTDVGTSLVIPKAADRANGFLSFDSNGNAAINSVVDLSFLTLERLDIDNVRIDGNTVSSTTGNLILAPTANVEINIPASSSLYMQRAGTTALDFAFTSISQEVRFINTTTATTYSLIQSNHLGGTSSDLILKSDGGPLELDTGGGTIPLKDDGVQRGYLNINTANTIKLYTGTGTGTLNTTFDGADVTIAGELVVSGNLTVDGTTTTINSTTLTVDDKNIVLASGASTSLAADGAGITIDGASATLTYVHLTGAMTFNKDVDIGDNDIENAQKLHFTENVSLYPSSGDDSILNLQAEDVGSAQLRFITGTGSGVFRGGIVASQNNVFGLKDSNDQVFIKSQEGNLPTQIFHTYDSPSAGSYVRIEAGSNFVKLYGSEGVEAQKYKDADDTSYYLEPAGTSVLATVGATQLNVDNITIDGNTISSTDTDGNINLRCNGSGVVDVDSELFVYGSAINGTSAYVQIGNSDTGGDDIRIQGPNPNFTLYDSTAVADGVAAYTGGVSFRGQKTNTAYHTYSTIRPRIINGLDSDTARTGALHFGVSDGANAATTNIIFKIEPTGADVTGNITVSGTVDGRDLQTDGTKLDGIETNADVTDATNVAAAGAAMTSGADFIGDITVKTSDGAELKLQTSDTTVGINDVLGKLSFNAPNEASGTDAILEAASIKAVAASTFTSSSNATRLQFSTGNSEAAQIRMTIAPEGTVSVGSISTQNHEGLYTAMSVGRGTETYNVLAINHSGASGNVGQLSFIGNTAANSAKIVHAPSVDMIQFWIGDPTSFLSRKFNIHRDGSLSSSVGFSVNSSGVVTADGLTSSSTIKAETTAGGFITLKRDDTTLTNNADVGAINFETTDTDDAGVGATILGSGDGTSGGMKLRFYTGTASDKNERLLINANGDISFFEDTGSTAKLVWTAADESLGIGGAAGTGYAFDVTGRSGYDDIMRLTAVGTNIGARINLTSTGTGVNRINATNNELALQTSGISRMTIDSSGSVGIGVVPSAWRSTTDAIQFGQSASISSNNNANAVSFTSNAYVNSSNNSVRISTGKVTNYYQYDGAHVWDYAGSGAAGTTVTYSEAMRIDSSGNLLVGTTGTDPNNATTASGAGTAIRSDGRVLTGVYEDFAADFNRINLDGEIIRLSKDGATVGSIGAKSDDLYINTGDTGLRFNDGNDQIWPVSSSGTSRDAAIDLGNSGVRFKDLYLSGSIEIENGTGNVGVGKQALNSNTGTDNTAVGYQAGYSNTTSPYNTFIGGLAGQSTTGSRNTFLGYNSGLTVSSGQRNTIIGRFSGNQDGLDIRTSSNNIVLSDGDGNPRGYYDQYGNYFVGDSFVFDSNWRTNDGWRFKQAGTHNYIEHVRTGTSDASANYYMVNNLSTYRFFSFNNTTSQIGSIANSGNNSVSYNTTSDYRLKENVEDIADGITRVKQLQPRRFSWISEEADAPTVDGFIAHEAQTVVPEAVHGTHNEVDADGNPVYQGIDQAKLVPLLTAALQEAITKIETLEARITALENA